MAEFADVLTVDMKDVASRMGYKIRFKNVRQFEWRVRLAMWIIRIAFGLMWMDVEFADEDEPDTV